MRRWSEMAERVAATTKASEKTTILAAYLAGLTPDELPVAAVFLTGRPFPEADQRSLGVGWSGLAGAVLRLAGAPDDTLRAAYDRSSDLSTAVTEVLATAGHAPDPATEPTLAEVRAAFDAIALASGPAVKAGMTRWFEAHITSAHGRYRAVEPTVVVEIAFDVLMRSSRHRSGFALRFPRIIRLRPDRTAADADTLTAVRALYEGLQQGAEHLVTASARK